MQNNTIYAPTHWDHDAINNCFNKFDYKEAIEEVDLDVEKLVDQIVYEEYSPLRNSGWTGYHVTAKPHDTSPGFPGLLKYKTEEEYYLEQMGCEQCVLSALQKGEWEGLYWYAFLKNETIKKAKIESADIRLICCPNSIYSRVGNCFEQKMHTKMKNNWQIMESKVGWTPFSREAGKVMERLEKHGDVYHEIDFTRYDGTIPKKVWEKVNKLKKDCYTGPHQIEYEEYRKAISLRPTILVDGRRVVMEKGNPSGQPGTSYDNCIVQTIVMHSAMLSWYKSKIGELPTPKQWKKVFKMITYGDDHLSSWNTKRCERPDSMYVMDFVEKKFGMWIKEENFKVTNKLEGMTFCGLTIVSVRPWKGVYNTAKIYSSLVAPSKPAPDWDVMWGKLASAGLLTANGDDEYTRKIRRMMKIQGELIPGTTFPTEDDFKNAWGGPKDLYDT